MSQSTLAAKTQGRLILQGLLAPIVIYALIFLVAGRWEFWQAWVYVILNTFILSLMSILAMRNPALVEERLNPKQGMKSWDKVYFWITTPLYLLALVIASLDARFGWTVNLPLGVYWLGVLVYLLGQAIFLWARFTNLYFSSVVRIQTDRGQTVCKGGPYRYVRHPGYVGGILFAITIGIILGSWWATIPQVIAAGMLVWRTGMEDRTLKAELPGYLEYTGETRYRLIPGIW
jgi:protein-S-isoprenylcysteine O-methyltransferase Ste14